jgi:hypothetical protein
MHGITSVEQVISKTESGIYLKYRVILVIDIRVFR